jgi:predicted TIM-barrel fold metal-dependent hydrolase
VDQDPEGEEHAMGMPTDIGIVDTMMGFPHADMKAVYRFITAQTRDAESKEEFDFPVEYMFKDVPEKKMEASADPVDVTLREMDLWGVEKAMIGVGDPSGAGDAAVKRYPDRFIASNSSDPNDGMAGVNRLVREYETYGVRACTVFPAGTFPQVPINDKKMYPLYAKCVELGLPIFVCAGIPGPRLKAACQHVELIDEVMYDFPELTFVTRHGCEPWTELAVKLMLKWPGLHFSTSAFAPKYYPQDIINYANTRGADKVIYAGYFPMGLSLERIMTEMPNVGFKDEVWPKFLRTNALRVLGLDA